MKNSFKVIFYLYKNLSLRSKFLIFISIFTLIVASFCEIVTLLSLYEFLTDIINSFNSSIINANQLNNRISFLEILPFQKNISLFLILLINLIFRLFTSFFQMRTITKVANELSDGAFVNLLNLDRDNFSNLSQYSESNLINTLVTQFNIFVAGILTPIFNIFTTSALITVLLISAFSLSFNTSLILFGVVILSYLFIFIISSELIKKNSSKLFKNNTNLINSLTNTLSILEIIQLRNLENEARLDFSKFSKILRTAEAQNAFLIQLPKVIVESIFIITVIFVILNSLSNANFDIISAQITVIYSLQKIIILSQQLVGSIINLRTYTPALESVKDLIDIPLKHKTTKFKMKINHLRESPQRRKLNTKQLKIELIGLKVKKGNIYINYPDLIFELTNSYVITGPSGCGKSTLLKILYGNFNGIIQGKILINNQLLFDSSKKFIDCELYKKWRELISFVDQNPPILSSSIRENLLFGGSNNLTKEKLKKVIRSVLMDDVINRLKYKLDTQITKKSPLSGGQNHRVAIAREIIASQKRPILFLDEPTSSIDEKTSKNLFKNIKENNPYLILIIVTHQPKLLDFPHKVINLN